MMFYRNMKHKISEHYQSNKSLNRVVKFLLKTKWLYVTIMAYAIVYLPIFVIGMLSFNRSARSYKFTEFSTYWYTQMFVDQALFEAIINTLLVAVYSTILAVVIGTFTAIGINALKRKMRTRFMILNNIPVINPDIVTGLSLMFVFSVLAIEFGHYTVLMAHVFFSIPFVVLTVLPKLKSLDKNLFDAALDLGCNRFQAIYKVIIPSIKSSIIAGGLIAFTMSIDDFVITYFTSGAKYVNVSLYLYSRIGRKNFSPAVYSYNTLLIITAIVVLIIFNVVNNRKTKEFK